MDIGGWQNIKPHLRCSNFLDLKSICYTIGMKREDYLKDYYKTLEEAPLDVLEEEEGNCLAAIEDYGAIGDKKSVKQLEKDLEKVREMIKKRRAE